MVVSSIALAGSDTVRLLEMQTIFFLSGNYIAAPASGQSMTRVRLAHFLLAFQVEHHRALEPQAKFGCFGMFADLRQFDHAGGGKALVASPRIHARLLR